VTYHVKDLEAGPLLDQAVLRALGAVHMQDCPEGVPDSVRERWPAEGAMVLTDEAGGQMFYGMRNIPPFSTEWGVGGPVLFDKARISLLSDGPGWLADVDSMGLAKGYVYGDEDDDLDDLDGERPVSALVAACRAMVRSNVGAETIDLLDPFAKFGTASAVQGPPGTR
jgi:hypothetical protein